MVEWISVKDKLPNDGEQVLIYNGGINVAIFRRGISNEEREKMKNGEIEDWKEEGWCLTMGYQFHKRSSIFKSYDEWGNNLVPYGWDCHGNFSFGQNVSHWAYVNKPCQN